MELTIKKDAPTYAHNRHWQFCVGSGHAALAMRSDHARQLKFIHDELGIKAVRFHGILNDDMNTLSDFHAVMGIPGLEKFTERTFHRVGLAYDNVLAAGMKPFVELSFMPKLLASAPARGGFYGSNFSLPKDIDAWAEHIRAFARFLIHRYGKAEVESWYFEVWNEPDLTGVFFAGTKEDYFKMYEATARALKEVDANLRVGGPATSGSKWVADYTRYCKENGVPVDFVSTHQYAGDPIGGVEDDGGEGSEDGAAIAEEMRKKFTETNPFEGLTDDAPLLDVLRRILLDETEVKDLPSDTFKKNAAVVKRQAQGLPVFYTEWNFCATFSAYSNDTRKAAAYVVKAALDTDADIDGSSIWCFSDIFEEFHQFTQEFHGGFGLLTLNGIPKPTFYALKMLAEAGGERVDLGADATDGEVGAAAFRDETGVQVMLFRFKMKSAALPAEAVNITIETGEKPANITIKRIDGEHCNPLALWEADGRPTDLTPAQVAGYIERSKAREEDLPFSYENGAVKAAVSLGANDLCFIQIRQG